MDRRRNGGWAAGANRQVRRGRRAAPAGPEQSGGPRRSRGCGTPRRAYRAATPTRQTDAGGPRHRAESAMSIRPGCRPGQDRAECPSPVSGDHHGYVGETSKGGLGWREAQGKPGRSKGPGTPPKPMKIIFTRLKTAAERYGRIRKHGGGRHCFGTLAGRKSCPNCFPGHAPQLASTQESTR